MTARRDTDALTKAYAIIRLLQDELAATNREVMALTLELEQRVADRTAELSRANQELLKEVGERKRIEEEVSRLNQTLERRALQLEASNSELEAFSYSVSHDLRAPLRHINGFAEILQEDLRDTLDETSRGNLKKIRDASSKMATLIDELLRFSRLSRTELSWTSIDLTELLDDVVRDFEPETEGRTVLWKIGPLPMIHGDRPMLRQVFINLISNALKYSRQRERTEIEIGLTESENERIFFVRDNGAGFDP